MELDINLTQRIEWLSERINLTEMDKDYIMFQMKDLVNELITKTQLSKQ
jgi:hypothetical protein